jgi:signal transduction histidine kinase
MSAPAPSSAGHLLVVDDAPEALELMAAILQRAGYYVRLADSGELALAAIAHSKPELILLDIRMPGLGGLGVYDRLKADPALCSIPVIFISGADDVAERLEGLQRGAVDFIVKPFDGRELLARASNHLDLARLRARLAQQSETLGRVAQQLEAEMLERRRAQEATQEQASRLALATRAGRIGIWDWNVSNRHVALDDTLLDICGMPVTSCTLSFFGWTRRIHPDDRKRYVAEIRDALTGDREYETEYRIHRPDGKTRYVRARGFLQRDASWKVLRMLGTCWDVTAQKASEAERIALQLQLTQAQKLESIGRLAAGVAHEINTPAQFVSDNISFVLKAAADIEHVLTTHSALLEWARAAGPLGLEVDAILGPVKWIKHGRLRQEVPAALADASEGMNRITNIIRAMKAFSHPSGQTLVPTDLNQAIESTVTVCRHEWRYVAELEAHLAPDLPTIYCLREEFSQVILNLIVNAAHAIGEVVNETPGRKGRITITTQAVSDSVEIRIEDTGTGIPESAQPHIFEPYFTTKEVGKGTGQGLAIARSVIVERLKGTIRFETAMGRGTTFILRLPVRPSDR